MDHINKLEQKVGRQETTRAAQQASFQQRVDDELEALQRDLEEEVVQERQTQDEEIVAALNRYVEQLQQSLSIPSSD
jgi:predicted 2-oxoglutarate/Fe(II)-dependent dioxygenase YbiX